MGSQKKYSGGVFLNQLLESTVNLESDSSEFCLDVRTLAFSQLMAFALNQKMLFTVSRGAENNRDDTLMDPVLSMVSSCGTQGVGNQDVTFIAACFPKPGPNGQTIRRDCKAKFQCCTALCSFLSFFYVGVCLYSGNPWLVVWINDLHLDLTPCFCRE